MTREIGYYWVKCKSSAEAEWVVAKWDGLHFVFSNAGPIRSDFLEIDERRIVRVQAEGA